MAKRNFLKFKSDVTPLQKLLGLLSPQDKIQTPQLNIQNTLHKPVSSSKSPSANSHHSLSFLNDVIYLFLLSAEGNTWSVVGIYLWNK